MTGHFRLSSSLFPFLKPVAFSSLFVIAGAGLACGGSDGGPNVDTGGQSAAAGSPAAGSGVGGANNAGAPASGGVGGVGTAGASPAAGAGGGGAGTGSVAGSGGTAGSGTAGSGTGGTAGAGGTTNGHWVGTWTASPYTTATADLPPQPLSGAVARQITHVSLGGSQIRVQFSNLLGTAALTIDAVHVALCKATPLVDGSIDTTTDKALTFSGQAKVSIPAGKEIWSDALAFNLPALANLTITTAFGTAPNDGTLTSHAGARTESFVVPNSKDVSVANIAAVASPLNHNQHWWVISGIDVMAPTEAKGAVAIGDSITDGRGVTINANNRWTDNLAKRMQANAPTANVSMMNQGIGGTALVGTQGTAAEARWARDVLGQSGVKYAIILDGVNDIGGSNDSAATLNAMKTTYAKLIKSGRDKGLLVYGGTIMPFTGYTGSAGYDTPAHEALRQEVNAYIKSGVFDGVIDFDAALSDGATPPSLVAAANSADKLHPGPAGYQMMADKVDLTLFTK